MEGVKQMARSMTKVYRLKLIRRLNFLGYKALAGTISPEESIESKAINKLLEEEG